MGVSRAIAFQIDRLIAKSTARLLRQKHGRSMAFLPTSPSLDDDSLMPVANETGYFALYFREGKNPLDCELPRWPQHNAKVAELADAPDLGSPCGVQPVDAVIASL